MDKNRFAGEHPNTVLFLNIPVTPEFFLQTGNGYLPHFAAASNRHGGSDTCRLTGDAASGHHPDRGLDLPVGGQCSAGNQQIFYSDRQH